VTGFHFAPGCEALRSTCQSACMFVCLSARVSHRMRCIALVMFNQVSGTNNNCSNQQHNYLVIQNYVLWHLFVDALLLLSVLYAQPVSNHVKQSVAVMGRYRYFESVSVIGIFVGIFNSRLSPRPRVAWSKRGK